MRSRPCRTRIVVDPSVHQRQELIGHGPAVLVRVVLVAQTVVVKARRVHPVASELGAHWLHSEQVVVDLVPGEVGARPDSSPGALQDQAREVGVVRRQCERGGSPVRWIDDRIAVGRRLGKRLPEAVDGGDGIGIAL